MADKLATTAAYTASGSAIIFGLSANEFAAYSGVLIGALTYLTNLWFKYQHLQIARDAAKAEEEPGNADA